MEEYEENGMETEGFEDIEMEGTKQENKIEEEQKAFKTLDDNTLLEEEPAGVIFDKSELLTGPKHIEVTDLTKGRFGWTLNFKTEDGTDYITNLNKTNYNQLLKWFGPRKGDWKGKKLVMSGESFSGQNKKTKEILSGITVHYDRE